MVLFQDFVLILFKYFSDPVLTGREAIKFGFSSWHCQVSYLLTLYSLLSHFPPPTPSMTQSNGQTRPGEENWHYQFIVWHWLYVSHQSRNKAQSQLTYDLFTSLSGLLSPSTFRCLKYYEACDDRWLFNQLPIIKVKLWGWSWWSNL